MKTALVTTVLVAIMSSASFAETKAEAGKYQVDPMHSKVGFEIAHLVISSVEGHFKTYSGEIEIAQDFTKSKVNANVVIDSISTDVKDRDDHLKSPDFFDAKKYPNMTFKSKSIKGTPESFKLEGDLSIHGVTKPVVFDAKYLGAVTDGYGNRKVAIQATAKINRKDFGLTWSKLLEAGPAVGDEVTISLKVQAAKAK